MKRFQITTALLAAALTAGACSPLFSGDDTLDEVHVGFVARDGDRVNGTGTVEWITIEGGFFIIRGDDGKPYTPTSLPAEFRSAGKRVRFDGRLRNDLAGFAFLGEFVELHRIDGE